MTPLDLSIVVPAFNEVRRLDDSLALMEAYLDGRRLDAEIIVVDDGSLDGTAAVARRRLERRRGQLIVNPANRGKGYSVRRGVLAAQGLTVLVTDADLSCPIEQHEHLARAMREGHYDVVIGSRGLPDSRIEVRQHRRREWMGRTFNRIVRMVTDLPYLDTQCGFKLMKRELTRPLFAKMTVDRFAYDVELLLLCARAGLRVGEVPVVWRNSPDSRVSLIGDSTRMLIDLARVAMRSRRANPGIAGIRDAGEPR